MSDEKNQDKLNTELGKAVVRHDVETVGRLLDQKADINYMFHYPGWTRAMTVLMSACRDGCKPLVELLVRRGADVHKRAQYGRTALHCGAVGGCDDVVQLLVENHADINVVDKYGDTPLHDAADYGREGTVKVLLRLNADPNITNKSGWTPLHKAALYGHHVVAGTLLKHRANPHVVDEHGKTALQLAEENGHPRVVEMLQSSEHETADVSDSWSVSDVAVETEQDRPAPVTSVSAVVDEDGGECKSPHVTLVVPGGAVSSPTAISMDTYVDHSVAPPVNVEEQLVLSPVVYLSPSSVRFNEPIKLSLPSHVPLKSTTAESGSVLELKMTDALPDDPSCQWYTALEVNTLTGKVTIQHPDVHFDVESGQVQLRHFCAICWIGKLLGFGAKVMRSVLYAAFGKKLGSHKWNIRVDVVDAKEFSYQLMVDRMKKDGFISLGDSTTATVDRHGEITLKLECIGQWQLYYGDAECQISTEAIGHSCTYKVNVEDSTETSKVLEFAVKASATSKGKPLATLSPSALVVGHPLHEILQIPVARPRDHFSLLVVCSQEFELRAAQRVFESGIKRKFVSVHHDLPFNIRLCRNWMSSPPTSVALVAQAHRGGTACMKLMPQLSKYFSADVIAMTGICAGEENKYGQIEHGCVVVAQRTTTLSGGKVTEDGQYYTQAQYKEVDERLIPSLSQLVEEGAEDWLQYVPTYVRRPSPRYVRELILHEIRESGTDGIGKVQLLSRLEKRQLPGMTRMVFDEMLGKMTKQANPWVRAGGEYGDIFVITHKGEKYVRNAVDFLREDKVNVVLDSMGTISYDSDMLDTEMTTLAQRMGDWKLKGIDQESYYFMEQASSCFDRGVAIVMKGISDYGTNISKLKYYQRMAAATSAAFLRHFLIHHNSLNKDGGNHRDSTPLPSLTPGPEEEDGDHRDSTPPPSVTVGPETASPPCISVDSSEPTHCNCCVII